MVEPKRAAACIIRNERGEILMGRRNDSLRFMAGHHVFPGGRVDESDTGHRVLGASDEAVASLVFTVVREVFEETGLLLTEGTLPKSEELREHRLALLDENVTLTEILDRYDLTINNAHFEGAGHWVTPEPSPIRFDTNYFLYHFPGGQQEELIEGEFLGLDWLHPMDARDRWHREDIWLSSPVAYTLHHIASVDYPEFLELLKRPIDRAVGVHKRHEIRRGIIAIPLDTATILPATQTNCIVIGDKDVLVFDPGADDPEELAHLKDQLDHLIALGSKVQAVVLTHSHPDHTGGVDFVKETYGVPLWAHPKTDDQIAHTVDRHLNEGDVLELPGNPGWRIQVMHTPGHDPGHLCFYEETTRTLLCGDLIANPGTIVVAEAYGGHMGDFLDSLQRIIDLEEARLVIPAHGMAPPNPRDYIKKQRDHRLWREAKIKAAWDSGARTIAELLAKSYDDVPKESLPFAEHAMRSHLTHLGLTAE